jgi:ribonuclease-3
MTKTNLPPLPDINSEHVRLQVFTHRSFYARQTHMFEDLPDDPSLDNEMSAVSLISRVQCPNCPKFSRLEHLGDSVLGLIVTDLLRELYPYLRVGAFAVSDSLNSRW